MTPEDLRAIKAYLQDRVSLEPATGQIGPTIKFAPPSEQDLLGAGLHPGGVRRLLAMPWWDEMIEDIVETPDMCEPDDTPEQVLTYARDVVSEYISKRFPLEDG